MNERKWRPIETAPTDGRAVLVHFWAVFAEKGAVTIQAVKTADRQFVRAPTGEFGYFTHWQPLPEPPERDGST